MELRFSGMNELEKELLKLDVKIAKKYSREAGKEAMKTVRDQIEAGANEDLGVLKDSIKMRASTAKGRSKSSKGRFMSIKAGVFTPKSERSRNAAALSQEYGDSKQDAEPFIRPAMKRNAQRVLNDFKIGLGRRIARHK